MFSEIRELNSEDLAETLNLLNQEFHANLFVVSRTSEILKHTSSSSILGYFEDGKLVSGVFYSANLVPFSITENAAIEFGKFFAKLHNRTASIVGTKSDVEKIWETSQSSFPKPRLVRENQLLFVLEKELPILDDKKVRKVELTDLDNYVAASVEMFTGEVGLPPMDLVEYRLRIKSQIEAGNSYAWFASDGRVLFKVDLGSQFNGAGQLQGVWLHPELRGRGFSVALLQMAINQIQRDYCRTITLYVNDFNLAALALYERLGFENRGNFRTIFF
ncbi:MAG: hypothetical protein RLZZ330_237 [Actinomycetota bacterium]|jgi:predicted GNAT family acetyltransferase